MAPPDFAIRHRLFDVNEAESVERPGAADAGEPPAFVKECASWSCARPSGPALFTSAEIHSVFAGPRRSSESRPREPSACWRTPQAERHPSSEGAEECGPGLSAAVTSLMYTPQVAPARLTLRSMLDMELNAVNAAHRAAAMPRVTELIAGQLYIGGFPDEETLSLLRQLQIRHIINCCAQDCATTPGVGAEFSVYDTETFDQQDYLILHHDYDTFAALVSRILAGGERVYVHCIAGINRSVTLCAAYLMDLHLCTPVDAVRLFRGNGRMRILENPGFRHQLVDHFLLNVSPRLGDEEERAEPWP